MSYNWRRVLIVKGVELFEGSKKSSSNHLWCVKGHIEEETAVKLQIRMGYNPGGYNFCEFAHGTKRDGTQYTYWECWNSCD